VVHDYSGGYSYYQANRDKGTPLTLGMGPQRTPVKAGRS
jgi:hypothetical protein